MIRWLMFLFVGLPTTMILYVVYPLIHLYWRVFHFKKVDTKLTGLDPITDPAIIMNAYEERAGGFHNNTDTHNMLTHWGKAALSPVMEGRSMLQDLTLQDGTILRSVTFKDDMFYLNGDDVSGDCLVSWCFAYSLLPKENRPTDVLAAVAKHYLKNLGCVSLNTRSVSNRCNNFGINYCPDSDFYGLGQPMAGPQFYTSSALFALAHQDLGGIWSAVYFIHWLLMGGWYWQYSPMLYTNDRKLGYVRDITMKALYVHKTVFGYKSWILRPMVFVADYISEWVNPLFEAMLNREPGELPTIVDPWVFQEMNGKMKPTMNSNVWIAPAIKMIRERV